MKKTTPPASPHSDMGVSMGPSRKRPAALEVRCDDCGLFSLCRAAGLESPDTPRFQQLVERRRPLSKGERLFRPGEAMHYLYAVKSGAIATTTDAPQGISGFYIPGEVLGLEAMADGHYRHQAHALTPTSVCCLNMAKLDLLGSGRKPFMQGLMRLMSQRLQQEHRLFQLLGAHGSEQRLATFLFNYSQRLEQKGLPSLSFTLPMTRRDLADYLGLALETISRMFQQLQQRGLLTLQGRRTTIVDRDHLHALSNSWQRHNGP